MTAVVLQGVATVVEAYAVGSDVVVVVVREAADHHEMA
jgi:hypothetical protein